jgi:hypothetical protein
MSTLAGLFTKKLPAGIWQFTFDEVGKGMKYVVNGRRYEFLAINGVMGITIDATAEKQLWYVISDDCTVQIEEVGQSANPFSSLPYEVGTWTPSIGGSSADGIHTYSTQLGTYCVIGDLVYINSRLVISGITTALGGYTEIIGLPFTALGNNDIIPVNYSNYNHTLINVTLKTCTSNRLRFQAYSDNSGYQSQSHTNAPMSGNEVFIFSGMYRKG